MEKIKIKPGDYILFALFAAVIVLFFVFIVKPSKTEKSLVLIDNGKDRWLYPLEKNARYEIPGKLGNSVIVVKDKKVFFEESPCKNNLCVYSKPIESSGKWIACLPNGVMVRIEGKNTQNENLNLDAVSE